MNQTSPFNALNELHRELGRVFDGRYGLAREPASVSNTNWAPQVDIKESDVDFTVLIDLPGMNPADVDITLHKGVLTIKGERSTENESSESEFRRRERIRGSFFRQFSLPESTDEEGVKARATNGVLEITIPKAEKPKPLTIVVDGD